MEVVLWRWSIGVQISSLAFIATFFLLLQRSLPRDAIAAWVKGWVFNFLAIAVALLFWIYPSESLRPIAFFLFMAPKNLAVLYLIEGGFNLGGSGTRLTRPAALFVGGVVLPLIGALTLNSIDQLGTVEQLVVGAAMFPAGIILLRARDRTLTWLAGGFLIRGGLCLAEAVIYATQLLPENSVSPEFKAAAATFLSAHSSFDTGAEWLLALGFVIGLSLRSQRELEASIRELREAQEDLRKLVDHDPLTSLLNRRALPGILRAAQPHGATLLFFDLDDFKKVNDERGHAAGDRCLKRVAEALRECFRPDDAFVRYGGDEFLVVARGLDPELAEGRVAAVRRRLDGAEGGEEAVTFSVGVAQLPPGGKPEEALRTADASMYQAKARRTARG